LILNAILNFATLPKVGTGKTAYGREGWFQKQEEVSHTLLGLLCDPVSESATNRDLVKGGLDEIWWVHQAPSGGSVVQDDRTAFFLWVRVAACGGCIERRFGGRERVKECRD